jgi:acyl-CoA thioester hydrolase
MSTQPIPPDEDPHRTSAITLGVRFCETDLMGIVHHANYLVYMEAGRVDWLLRRGARYQAWMERGIHLPVVETRLRYRKTARFGDSLTIETTCAEITRVTVRFRYRVLRGEEIVCEGETLLACVGNDLLPRRFPEDVLQILRSAECA